MKPYKLKLPQNKNPNRHTPAIFLSTSEEQKVMERQGSYAQQ